MKNTFFFLVIVSVAVLSSCDSTPAPKMQTISVEAPFDMPDISIPDFSNCREFPITDFGAEQGDKNLTGQAIAAAIDSASHSGGGRVVIPEGIWFTGKIHLKSNVDLHLSEGAVLVFSDDPADYLPAVHTSWEGLECYNYSPLIYAYECENVAITGKGELKAKMDLWQTWFGRPSPHMESLKRLYFLAAYDSLVHTRNMVNDTSHFRPHFIQFNRCKHILMEDVKITNSPFWTIHTYMSSDIVIRGLQVYAHGHNNDGVDPEMSQNMLIENCIFDQGDDAIAVKSGRNQEAWRLDTPSKNIVIRNCTVKNGHQLLAIGSELSGGIENIYMDSCRVLDGARLYHLLFIKTNERRGGYVSGIYMKNIECGKIDQGIIGIETDVLYQWRDLVPTLERRLTPISNIKLENVQAGDVKFISHIEGQEELPVEGVHLVNVQAANIEGDAIRNHNVLDFVVEN